MIGIIHSNWDSDIVLEKGDLEKLISTESLVGEIACYLGKKQIGELSISLNKEILAPGYYFKLNWNRNESSRFHFELYPEGFEKLKENNYVHGRYDEGAGGSKLGIYGDGKDDFTKDNIEFAIEMIKLEKDKS